ncbi:D-alanine--D-alanine ligase [Sedimentibacter sp. zth1]|uniref:D-alanine--D-alanine ligase family protein n=1 Tax=Sedimentibacter sp. zth1 TaxID=2816908 RepID=UPI001A937FF6|nr:D-alanine--D-alanine ligase family protein [Sedimentibacter sp. zth1]QSX06245.1 D-alanine--D-alanine ligase [Sedimentibacter sp. zth1]
MKKIIGILIGGKSVEHEVSIVTGLQVFDNIDREKYEPVMIYINSDGKWFIGKCLNNINNYKSKSLDDAIEVIPYGVNQRLVLVENCKKRRSLFSKNSKQVVIDIVFPAVHGTNCEDGTLHGFFQMNNIPCAFGNTLSSAIGMDKVIMKKIFKSDGLPIPDFTWFYNNEYIDNAQIVLDNAEKLGYPLIVKPSNLGSSVGINKASNRNELIFAIEVALSYDKKIIIEECIENAREINCAILGYENYLVSSMCEEPLGWKDFLTFEDKYMSGEKNSDIEKRKIPADIDTKATENIKKYAKQAFKSIDCEGNARIDFLYDGNNIYINEINTIPGSIAFYMWEYSQIKFSELITKILDIAEICNNDRASKIINYDIDLLNNMTKYNKCK